MTMMMITAQMPSVEGERNDPGAPARLQWRNKPGSRGGGGSFPGRNRRGAQNIITTEYFMTNEHKVSMTNFDE